MSTLNLKWSAIAAVVAILWSGGAVGGGNQVQTNQALLVVDANGKTVGRYSGSSVFATIKGTKTVLALSADKVGSTLLNFAGGSIYFQSTDCTGTPYLLQAPAQGVLPSTTLRSGGRTYVYIAQQTTAIPEVQFGSQLKSAAVGDATCILEPDIYYAYPTSPPADITKTFAPPFTIQ